MPSNDHICPCPNPPGGSIACRPDQLAICAMEDGELRSGCVDISQEAAIAIQDMYRGDGLPTPEFLMWVFSAIMERPLDQVALEQFLSTLGIAGLRDPELLTLLNAGKLTWPRRSIYFRLPQTVKIPELA